ncbi:MAG: hypothetical protein NXI24_16535 [bacterium]|nr:hypothetical protein [bacterium]
MNTKTVGKLIEELSELPLDVLGASDLSQLDKILRKNISKIRRTRLQLKIDAFWNRLPPRARNFFPVILKKHSMKPPKKSDSPEVYANHLAKLEKIWEREGPAIEGLEAKLRRIREYTEVEALNELRALSTGQRKELSKYAGLTALNAGRRSALNLSSSALRNRQWLDALKKQRLDTILDRKR